MSPLRNQTYRRLFTAQVVALAGTGLTSVALALLAWDIAGGEAGKVLGLALALKMVAYVGVAPVVGAFAHLLPRKGLLISLDLARAAGILCLPFVTEVWQIYLLIFLINGCSAGFTPTFQATIPDVLPEEGEYTRALSLSRLAYDLENLLSPMVAAAALVFLTYDHLFAINAAAFGFSALLVFSVRLPSIRIVQRPMGFRQNLTYGILVYLKTPRLRGLLALSVAVAMAGAMVIVNTVIYVREYLGGTESHTALAFAAFGAGSMSVALALPKLLDLHPDRPFMLAGGALSAVALLVASVETSWLVLLPAWFILGMGSSLIQTPAGRLLQRSSNEHDRPAIYAAQFTLSHACWLLAYPLTGWLVTIVDLQSTFGVLAAIVVFSTAAAIMLWPASDQTDFEHVHEPVDHEHLHTHDDHHDHLHDGSEGPEPHNHPHAHEPVKHSHPYVIDLHHPNWPAR